MQKSIICNTKSIIINAKFIDFNANGHRAETASFSSLGLKIDHF